MIFKLDKVLTEIGKPTSIIKGKIKISTITQPFIPTHPTSQICNWDNFALPSPTQDERNDYKAAPHDIQRQTD
jgi:hypothetical protein